jgi:hypothetical protein
MVRVQSPARRSHETSEDGSSGEGRPPGTNAGSDRPGRHDRAQLVILGAIVLAALVIGLVPVYNAVFAADSAGNGEPTELTETALAIEDAAVQQARVVAVRVGHGQPFADADTLTERYDAALRNGTAALGETTVQGTDHGLNVSFDPGAPGTVNGTRVVRTTRGGVLSPAGADDWTVASDTRLGWAVVRLEAANLSRGESLDVTATDADNASRHLTVSLERTDASNDVRVTVSGTVGATPEDVTCEPSGGEVVVDLYRGRSATEDCRFVGLRQVTGPVDLAVEDGDAARGTYEFVVRNGSTLPGGVLDCQTPPAGQPSQPCRSPALWTVALETRVTGERATYTTAANVSVYGEGVR